MYKRQLNGPTVTTGGSVARLLSTTTYAQAAPGQAVAPGQYGHLAFNDQPKTLPAGPVAIQGNFDPGASDAHTVAGSTVAFDGAGAQIIARDVTLNNVNVSSGVTLTTAARVTVTGVLSNLGWTKELRAVSGSGILLLGLANIALDVTTRGTLDSVEVVRRDESHPSATDPIKTSKWWAITPTGSGYTVKLTLPRSGLTDPKVCKWPGGLGGSGWNCARDDFDGATVWRSGLTAFSDWAAGNNAGPTAVTLNHLSQTQTSEVWLPVALLVIGGGGAWLARRRSVKRA